MIIMGIDPGLAIVGYGIVNSEKGNVTAIDYGVVETPKNESVPARLHMIYDGINALFDKFKPDCVAIEELFFTKNITTGINVAQARGVVLLACSDRCGRLYEYTPMQIKQAITGYGKADKKFGLKGQLLHASRLILTHPSTGERMEFTSPLPDHFQRVLDGLKPL